MVDIFKSIAATQFLLKVLFIYFLMSHSILNFQTFFFPIPLFFQIQIQLYNYKFSFSVQSLHNTTVTKHFFDKYMVFSMTQLTKYVSRMTTSFQNTQKYYCIWEMRHRPIRQSSFRNSFAAIRQILFIFGRCMQ